MTFKVRRVVTGHDQNGKAVVLVDEVMDKVVSFRPGMSSHVAWATDRLPPDNGIDTVPPVKSTTIDNGTVFRVIEFGPGVTPRNHRTDSLDYAVVMKGEIDMEMDGTVVHLKAGDVLVQRGTIHNWVNNGKEPCVIAFVLISAPPVAIAGKKLNASG